MIFSSIKLALNLGKIGEGTGFGPWGYGATTEPGGILATIISNAIGVMTICAGIWFIFQLIIGAFGFLTAGSDAKSVEAAKKKLTNAVIGLAIVVAAYALISLMGALLGLPYILDPEQIISILKP